MNKDTTIFLGVWDHPHKHHDVEPGHFGMFRLFINHETERSEGSRIIKGIHGSIEDTFLGHATYTGELSGLVENEKYAHDAISFIVTYRPPMLLETGVDETVPVMFEGARNDNSFYGEWLVNGFSHGTFYLCEFPQVQATIEFFKHLEQFNKSHIPYSDWEKFGIPKSPRNSQQ